MAIKCHAYERTCRIDGARNIDNGGASFGGASDN